MKSLFATPAFAFVLLLGLLCVPGLARAQMLSVQTLDGTATLLHKKKSQPAEVGTALQDQDTFTLDDTAHVELRLGRHGVVELGPGAEVFVERLPVNAVADDLQTVVRLRRGYMRVLWKQPPAELHWPFLVYLDGDHAAVSTGEYFVERTGNRATMCVATGELGLSSDRDGSRALAPETCQVADAGQPIRVISVKASELKAAGKAQSLDFTDEGVLRTPAEPIKQLEFSPVVVAQPAPVLPPPEGMKPPGVAAPAAPQPPKEPAPAEQNPATTAPPVAAETPSPKPVPPPEPQVAPSAPSAAAPAPAPASASAPTPAPTPTPITIEVAVPDPSPAVAPAAPSPAPDMAEAAPPADTVAEPKPKAARTWSVNVASLVDQRSADLESRRVRLVGFDCVIQPAMGKGRLWYLIQVRGFETREKALEVAEKLKAASFVTAWVPTPKK